MTHNDDLNPDKVRQLIGDAIDKLDKSDLAERLAWCVANGVHGATFAPLDDDGTEPKLDNLCEIRFGGARLALVAYRDLCGPGPLDVEGVRGDVPDTIEGLDDD